MDDIDIPADRVPEGLKACEQILKRAKEVKKVEPVVAYWCTSISLEQVADPACRPWQLDGARLPGY
jgi:vacuolar protein sorting-associated protein VTA1